MFFPFVIFALCYNVCHIVLYVIMYVMCNNGCRQPTKCPLDGNCLSSCIIYKATVSLEKEQVTYIGLTSTTFKERYNNHRSHSTTKNMKMKQNFLNTFGN